MVSARDVAAELRTRLPSAGRVQVHKWLYLAQGHHLATFGTPLFHDTISAWDMGPVVGALWRAEQEDEDLGEPRPLDEAELNTVGYVVSRYGGLSSKDLINLTHSQAPWKDADAGRPPRTSIKIQPEAIRDYFVSVDLDEDGDVTAPIDGEVLASWLRESAAARSAPSRPDSIERLRARLAR